MNGWEEFHELGSHDLSDDELDLVAGGIPYDDRDPGFGSNVGHFEPRLTATQSRPNDDPGLWY